MSRFFYSHKIDFYKENDDDNIIFGGYLFSCLPQSTSIYFELLIIANKTPSPKNSEGSSIIRVFPVCNSDNHFVNSSPENQNFI